MPAKKSKPDNKAPGSRKGRIIEAVAETVIGDKGQAKVVDNGEEIGLAAVPAAFGGGGRMGGDDDDLVFGDDEYLGLLQDLATVENRITISVYMRSRESRSMARLFSVDPLEFPKFADLYDFCRREYGAGYYQLRVYAEGRKGTKHLKNFEVIESDSQRRARLAGAMHGGAQETGPASVIVEKAIEQANTQQDKLLSIVGMLQERAFAPPSEKKADLIDNLVKLSAAFAPALPLLIKMWPKRQDPVEQLRNAIAVLKEVGGENSGGGNNGEPMGMMDVLGKMVDKLGPALATAALAQQQQPLQGIQEPSRLGYQGMAPLVPTNYQQPKVGENEMLHPDDKQKQSDVFTKLQKILEMCVGGAVRGGDPLVYAEMAVDQLTDEELEELARHLPNPQLMTVMATLEPRIADHQEWFGQFHIGLGIVLSDEEESEESTNSGGSAIPQSNDNGAGKNDANGTHDTGADGNGGSNTGGDQ